ncbi:MAG: biopolymer transport protein ExbB [Puniceicoccaceae bacterium 5H]|nr:MAG: biopolymer transport protein ExbB [Puniceicoccaceae bacterium 5H]
MNTGVSSWHEALVQIWTSGGWLMVPLLALTCFIYYTAIELYCRVHFHFLLRAKVHQRKLPEITAAKTRHLGLARQLLLTQASSMAEVRRHFQEVRNEYLPAVNRRIRFLGIIITAGPLLGLLGTVTGMLSTFDGMVHATGDRFDSIVTGISEALITTQMGLLIAIPALIILSLIVQRRNDLVHAIARLERLNAQLALRSGCPVKRPARQAQPQTVSVS